ncbi:MAG: energy-coupling factor transporter transmembrane protein EcfT [Elusimicrobia bacterium]|nr:energy-coupling factor transporter transmembrane protein EcfT [Elusimicrobiota bacterium]
MDIAGRFIFGRYSEVDSPLHRLDPRAKLFFIFVLSVTLFIAEGLLGFIFPTLLLLLAITVSKIGYRRLIGGVIPIIWMVFFTFILNYLASGIDRAVLFSSRIILLFCWASLLTATTRSEDTGRAVSWYLSPLKIFKVSTEKISLVFTMAIRFFPLLLDEAESILRAQKLKKQKLPPLDALINFSTVFMIRILKRADGIELSLTNRGLLERNLKLKPSVRGNFLSTTALGVISLLCLIIAL